MTQVQVADPERLTRAYGRLRALKTNLPDGWTVSHLYVQELHAVLDELEACGWNVSEFRVPAELVKRRLSSFNSLTGEEWYGETPEIERDFLKMKIDGIVETVNMPNDLRHVVPDQILPFSSHKRRYA